MIKTRFLAAFACLALVAAPLAACSSIAPVPSLEQTTLDEKAIYSAEATYRAAATAASAAVDSGLLVPGTPRAVQVADALQTAYDALRTARAAYAAGNGLALQTALSAANAALASAQRTLRPSPG